MLHAFGEGSIFSGVTLYNDSLVSRRQRSLGAEKANRALTMSSDDDSQGESLSLHPSIHPSLPPSLPPSLHLSLSLCLTPPLPPESTP